MFIRGRLGVSQMFLQREKISSVKKLSREIYACGVTKGITNMYSPWETIPYREIYACDSNRHHRCLLRSPPPREKISPAWKTHSQKFTVVSLCALLMRDLSAIAKCLVWDQLLCVRREPCEDFKRAWVDKNGEKRIFSTSKSLYTVFQKKVHP